jgi:hypothetical protein
VELRKDERALEKKAKHDPAATEELHQKLTKQIDKIKHKSKGGNKWDYPLLYLWDFDDLMWNPHTISSSKEGAAIMIQYQRDHPDVELDFITTSNPRTKRTASFNGPKSMLVEASRLANSDAARLESCLLQFDRIVMHCKQTNTAIDEGEAKALVDTILRGTGMSLKELEEA